MGVLATLYIARFNRLWRFWRRFIYILFSKVIGVLAMLYIECFLRLQGFLQRFIQRALLGYWGFGDALYRVFYQVIGVLVTLYIMFYQVMGFFAKLYIECFNRFIQSDCLGYWGFGNALYRVFYQVIGVLAMLYIVF